MRTEQVCVGKGPYQVKAVVTFCGDDLVVVIGGGELPHVGAVALGIPRPSLADSDQPSASVSVLCVTGHKEDELARATALELATRFECRVVVTIGIHIDNASSGDLTTLTSAYKKTFDRVVHAIQEIESDE